MSASLLEIVDLGDGEVVLQRADDDSEPLVSIRFSDEARIYLMDNGLVRTGSSASSRPSETTQKTKRRPLLHWCAEWTVILGQKIFWARTSFRRNKRNLLIPGGGMRFDLQDNSILIDGRAALTRNTLDFLQETLDFQQETLTISCERFALCAAYPAILWIVRSRRERSISILMKNIGIQNATQPHSNGSPGLSCQAFPCGVAIGCASRTRPDYQVGLLSLPCRQRTQCE